MRIAQNLFLLALAAFSLSACSDAREIIGLNNQPPDEFMVVDHPPLSMPPDYALRPPRAGQTPTFQDVQPSKAAAEALYGPGKMELVQQKGVAALPSHNLSSSEQVLIASTGSANADPRIRSQLDKEASQQVVTSRRLIDAILFRDAKPAPATVVDPVAERKRIEAAKANNQAITTGATPVTGARNATSVQ